MFDCVCMMLDIGGSGEKLELVMVDMGGSGREVVRSSGVGLDMGT